MPYAANGRIMPTSFYLDDSTRKLLEQLVKELDMTRSAVVREALRRMVSDSNETEVRRLVAELSRVVEGR